MRKFTSQEIKEFVAEPHFDEKVILNKDPSWSKVSIVTPSYNQAQFLERTILSVLNQNYPNLEYIIIDGGSTDGSVEIIKKYKKYLAYWMSERDNGQADAINKGFIKSTGEILAWQNSDDTFEPEVFYTVARYFKKKNANIVFGNVNFIDENDKKIKTIIYGPFLKNGYLFEGPNITNQSAFWRREIFLKVGMLNEKYRFAMDFDYYMRLADYGAKFKYVNRVLGNFRVHKNSKCSTIKNIGIQEYAEIRQRYGIKMDINKPWSSQYRLIKAYFRFRRLFWYIAGGNFRYLLFRFI